MAVLEITQLRLRGLPADDPQLLQSLSIVRGKLQTNSRFYSCIEDPTLLYILGIWPNLDAHHRFLASPERDEVLGPEESMLDFQWSVHVELDSMNSLPLDAPILALEILAVREDCVEEFDQAATKHAQALQGSNPFKVAHGWRCDARTGSHEALIFTGWNNTQAHVTFSSRQKSHSNGVSDQAPILGQYEELPIHHFWDVERKDMAHP
ncbi:hypothetical protein EK21DRAFT_106898 [Setomelanomma holmii]|uniref:ABM domain-containing protein n=1 Tax=Setomelanomma holmii TaxID=210430 RepID=A0A9P4HJF6_9PLEO|nr:hypothetical protein EK21DRAFT_106898 [Setomelanomma holmii]